MKVALFVTCLADHYFAEAATAAVRLLRHLGCEVTFPDAQTCCGQPAYNSGMTREAARMARHTMDVFADCEAVVLPSGSCATMVKKFYPRIAASDRAAQAAALADRTFELGEFIVRRLGVTRLGDGLAGRRVAVHQGCHALRELRLEREPAMLLEGSRGRGGSMGGGGRVLRLRRTVFRQDDRRVRGDGGPQARYAAPCGLGGVGGRGLPVAARRAEPGAGLWGGVRAPGDGAVEGG